MKTALLSTLCTLAMLPFTAHAQDTQTLRFGVDPSYPPFESKAPDGSYVGFDIDLGNALCAQLHKKCVWVEQNFDGMIPALKARKFDAILSAMSATPTRRQQIDFSHRLYLSSSALIAAEGSSLQPTAQALQGKRVGVVQGSTQESYANAEWAPKNVTVVSYQTQDQIYQDLVTHRIDAAFQAAVQADFGFVKTPRGAGFALVGKPVSDGRVAGDVAIGLRKGDAALETEINQSIVAIRHDGVYQKVAARYFNFDIYGD
ncbi:ABC transporter substrate-binding protein [Paraburkholderia metrosideri]|uniref:Lysine/arginine/ornithine-binding periplasmic protein n=1 Tax=Paraburkholderia metrosideri TaxID=580937 RepID=A0ABM8NWY0_9BURK|nr:ABC transporter substrate-binding protein [Paraburkholderia metrosideri]CAD6547394.1 Lysine/arginine/ornithine-binding periplasmic protein [Paraburkholderia metrosideri]